MRVLQSAALCVFGAWCAIVNPLPAAAAQTAAPGGALRAYANEAEFVGALTRWRERSLALQREQTERRRLAGGLADNMAKAESATAQSMAGAPTVMSTPAPAAPPQALAQRAARADAAGESITNVQTAGVDEGGIVKHAGDHLVVLRRGRLFTIKVGGDDLRPVASIDAFAPGAGGRGAWYDEMLISGSTIVVIGYSYQRGGTEIGLFDLGRDGSLGYRSTYHLRGNDYYSSRNYASRLVGTRLIFYTPTMLNPWQANPWTVAPALRRWTAELPQDFERILPATRIHRTDDDFAPLQPLALHTVSSCELAVTPMRCESSAVLGPPGRVFYVSQDAVYVWTAGPQQVPFMPTEGGRPVREDATAALFRMPLDGGAPSGIKTVGMPIDQLSFVEEAGHLNVLLRDMGAGEGMFGAERARPGTRLALLRLPISAFGDGRGTAARDQYRRLPDVAGTNLQNRHVGDWLVWGSGERAWAIRPASADTLSELEPGHAVERIEAMGKDAMLVGNRGSELMFSSLRLDRRAMLVASHSRPGARQGESRTHGFFYRPTGPGGGLLGLPTLGQHNVSHGMPWGARTAPASVVFLRQRDLRLTALGELAAQDGPMRDDACRASCADWYGNARPIFLGTRVFALIGYELVEGRLDRAGEAISERRRTDFGPFGTGSNARPSPFS